MLVQASRFMEKLIILFPIYSETYRIQQHLYNMMSISLPHYFEEFLYKAHIKRKNAIIPRNDLKIHTGLKD